MTTHTAAHTFHHLHQQGLLVLANAWDAGSARLIASLGAKAIATTSAGVSWSHGYADGDVLPVALLVSTVQEIARVIQVPLTVDIEGGYASDPASVGETVARVIEAGAVGVNLEDGGSGPDVLAAKIEHAKRAGARLGVDVFVNARTDVYLRSLESADRRVDETLARAERYRAAGADGIFVPGAADASDIRAIAAAARLPLNVMAWPGLPAASELERLGARRLSAGSGITQAVYGHMASLATGFLQNGGSIPVAHGAMSHAELNALMAEGVAT